MIATKTLTGGGGTELVIAADEHRDYILIQLQSSDTPTYLAFGEDAVDAEGTRLLYPQCSVTVRGSKARLAVNGISAGNAVLGIETCEQIEYRCGANPLPAQ